MKRLLFLLSLFIGQLSPAQKVTDSTFGKPILLYTVFDPWAMFMGAEGPLLIVYESSKVIFWKDREYKIAQLDKMEIDGLMTEMNLSDTFFLKSKSIQATLSTDQPSYILNINLDTLKYFSLYGSMNDKYARKYIPEQLSKIYDYVIEFDNDNANSWVPDKIEIMLSDYSHLKAPCSGPVPGRTLVVRKLLPGKAVLQAYTLTKNILES